jgi:hypothetical protein
VCCLLPRIAHAYVLTLAVWLWPYALTNCAPQYASGGDLWAFLQANSSHLSERTCVALVLQVWGGGWGGMGQHASPGLTWCWGVQILSAQSRSEQSVEEQCRSQQARGTAGAYSGASAQAGAGGAAMK